MRAAASSIASGSPSRRRQISAIARRVLRGEDEILLQRPARAAKSRTARNGPARSLGTLGGVTSSGGTGCSCSPERRSRTRLVTRTFKPWAGAEQDRATTGAASTTCSKLSSTKQRALDPKAMGEPIEERIAAPFLNPERASDCGNDQGRIGNRAEADEPDLVARLAPRPHAAAARASRVLPTPPGPVRVSSRTSSRRSRSVIAATSRSRPISGVSGWGSRHRRLVGPPG